MIKFEFKTNTSKYFKDDDYDDLIQRKDEIINKLHNSKMNGWINEISSELIEDLKKTALMIKNTFDIMVVVGIGGSFLGSCAFDKMFRRYFDDNKFEIIYAGTTLSSKYMSQLIDYLKDKNFCINVISKSGTTMETSITYTLLKNILIEKYSVEEIKKRIILTTDEHNGLLREEAKENGYKSFIIPNDIGGRYSFITPAHLLPLAINYDLDNIINGYYSSKNLLNEAYEYACIRYLLFKNGKYIENYVVHEENMLFFSEWLKQLFGESEGKNGLGIFPVSTLFTRDLHSLGQFIQDGNKIIFETFIRIKNSLEDIYYDNKKLNDINNLVIDSVKRAHEKGSVPCINIEMDYLTLENVSSLILFFEYAAAFSGFIYGINPFDQPGVEVYKKEVRDSLNK